MSIVESIVLGIIQGVTEFLPISSSGHLLIARTLFNINELDLFLEIFLHAGTLLSIILFWRREINAEIIRIVNKDLNYFYKLVVATIPAGLIGLLLKDKIELLFYSTNSSQYLILTYLIMAFILYTIRNQTDKKRSLTFKIAIIIGLVQAIAILPGISRSGITICIGCLCGLSLKKSTEFSFFIAIPIMLLASIYSIFSNLNIFYNNDLLAPLIYGFAVSSVVGYIVIKIMVKITYNNKFWFFSIYCFCISLILLGYNYVI